MKNRKTNARKLYEHHLADDKWEFLVILDEAGSMSITAMGYKKFATCNLPKN